MALFGAQLVFTMVMASFLQKLSQHLSLGRWLITHKLVRYLHPTHEDLKSYVPGQSISAQGRGRHRKDKKWENGNGGGGSSSSSFTVPKSVPLRLDQAPVEPMDVLPLPGYLDYQWLVDFALCTSLVYGATELYYAYCLSASGAARETNLSVLWCCLALLFTIKTLASMTGSYFKGEDSGERSLVLVFSFLCLVLAMIVLIVDERILEFGLDDAYKSFNESASVFLNSHGLQSSGPARQITMKLCLVLWSVFTAALLAFPGLRLARMHNDALIYCGESPVLKLLLYVNFLWPVLMLASWVRPVARDTLPTSPCAEDLLEAGRLWLAPAYAALRLALTRPHLQAYLNLAATRIEDMKRESGRISAIELQRKVVRIFYYMCIVSIQYAAPVCLILFTTCLLKTLGGYQWLPASIVPAPDLAAPASNNDTAPDTSRAGDAAQVSGVEQSITETAEQLHVALASLRTVFSPVFFRGVLAYMAWWTSFVYFLACLIGLFYVSSITV